MLDTFRLSISNPKFYQAVINHRQDDLGGYLPARINVDAIRGLVTDGKIVDFESYRDHHFRDLLADLNQHGLNIVIRDIFQLFQQGSWCRDITLCIDEFNRSIIAEVSLPKFFNGQNVTLLYDYKTRILDFVSYLYQYFRLTVPSLDEIMSYTVSRIDICYYYKMQSQIHATDFINSFKMWARHKRKKVHHYDTSMMFVGRSYSLKFYMKFNEFQKHDKRFFNKNITTLYENTYDETPKEIQQFTELIKFCDSYSTGMVRAEFTLRKQKLHYDGIFNIADVLNLDICAYYENLLERMGVLTMGKTKRDEYFERLKCNKKLLQYCALLETFGPEKIKEVYNRSTIYRYNKRLSELQIYMGEFDLLQTVSLVIRDDDRARVNDNEDGYKQALRFVAGNLF